MTDAAPHPTPRSSGPGALLLIVLAALLALVAGLVVVVVLPFVLVLTIMGGTISPAWPIYLWIVVAFLAGIYTIRAGLAGTDDPRTGRILRLLGIALIAFFSFPPFWLSGS